MTSTTSVKSAISAVAASGSVAPSIAHRVDATFFLGIFQVSSDIPQDIEASALLDELLTTAHALLGIVNGNIPDDSAIANAARFLIEASQAGHQSMSRVYGKASASEVRASEAEEDFLDEREGKTVTIPLTMADSVWGELDAAHDFLDIAWGVMNDAARSKLLERLRDARWNLETADGAPNEASRARIRDAFGAEVDRQAAAQDTAEQAQSLSSKTTRPARAKAPEFFSFNGKYEVAPETTVEDLHNDIGCWLDSAHSALDLIVGGLQEEGGQMAADPKKVARALYGVFYQVELVRGALSASYEIERANRST